MSAQRHNVHRFFPSSQSCVQMGALQKLIAIGYLPRINTSTLTRIHNKLTEMQSTLSALEPFDVLCLLKIKKTELHNKIAEKAILDSTEVCEFDEFIGGLDIPAIKKAIVGGSHFNFSVLGIGSIIDPESKSTQRTFNEIERKRASEALGFGFQRRFNYNAKILPFDKNPYFNDEKDHKECIKANRMAAIGMHPTGSLNDVTTGTLYPFISDDTFIKLLKREWGYRIVPVLILRMKRSSNKVILDPMITWTFEPKKHMLTNTQAKPMMYYTDVCLNSATHLWGNEYSRAAWVKTTKLADGSAFCENLDEPVEQRKITIA